MSQSRRSSSFDPSSSLFPTEGARVKLSKKLSGSLRHHAKRMHLRMSSDGFVTLSDLLRHPFYRDYRREQVEECVSVCEKQRFELKTDETGVVRIRATQGHTLSLVQDEELLERLTDTSLLPVCLHGTYRSNIDSIRRTGLNRMKRNHIHLIACLPGDEGQVISGMRKSADTIVTVDVEGAMKAGIPFYRSSNGVILSPGLNNTGCIPPEYISDIIDRKSAHIKRQSDLAKQSDLASLPSDDAKKSVFSFCEELHSLHAPPFTHFCVVDFEATCLDNEQIRPQEIIEFPAVMVSASDLTVVTEFQSYVRPLHHPVLSNFCTNLTGITQERVDAAPDFKAVYQQFGDFIQAFTAEYRSNNEGRNPSVLFVSCGDWDFKTMLPSQCKTTGLSMPPLLSQWMNVKVLFTQTAVPKSGHAKGKKKLRLGMVGMLEHLDLPLVGRHHSGIDDSRNIANILIELVKRGGEPRISSDFFKSRMEI